MTYLSSHVFRYQNGNGEQSKEPITEIGARCHAIVDADGKATQC